MYTQICVQVATAYMQVSLANNQGDSPLHFACQYCPAGKTLTLVKLLQHDASVATRNRAGDTPFDLAVRFNKKGVLYSVLE